MFRSFHKLGKRIAVSLWCEYVWNAAIVFQLVNINVISGEAKAERHDRRWSAIGDQIEGTAAGVNGSAVYAAWSLGYWTLQESNIGCLNRVQQTFKYRWSGSPSRLSLINAKNCSCEMTKQNFTE